MKLAFETLLEANNLAISELPKITQIEIKELNQLKGVVESKRTIGQNISPATIEKMKEKDNSIVDDILEYLGEEEDEDESDEATPEEDEDSDDMDDPDGVSVDSELNQLLMSGQTTLGLDQLRSYAPTTYEILFDTYGQDEKNGIITSNFSLIETDINSQEFKILKR